MKLYAFTTPDIPKNNGYLKIGETNGDIDKRVEQECHELNVKKEIVWRNAVITERRGIDKMIHRYLANQGFQIQQFDTTGQNTEWIKCTVADIEKAFAAVKEQLYQDEIKRQALCDKFYLEIRNWYYWTAKTGNDPYSVADPEFALRLIVRLLLCFFLQEKGLVPQELFDEHFLKENLKENEEYRYYNAILRNLFFHCLNTPHQERNEFEHKKLIKNIRNIKEQFQKVPFLNGGLFYEYEGDDFPLSNDHFFSELQTRHILELDGDYKVAGIIKILSQYRYKLTVDDLFDIEYTQTVDPEFIGKVFESLLACIDADTEENRRKTTGSFYTPLEIVDYMVGESLDTYLQNNNDLLQCKILDPACGSGVFPCGVMNEIIRRIDPDKQLPQNERYRKKLEILQKVIYCVDIQSMATHISSLRLFLSLIQELVPDKKKENYGIEPLPNLETKFICANTLIGLKNGKQQKLELPIIKATIKQLLLTREQHLIANNPQEKKRLQEYDETLRQTLSIAMEDAGDLSHDTAELLLQWNPYNQSKPSPFFDPMWMFGVEKFDIVIGNPPYGAKYPPEHKKYFKEHYESAKTIQGKQKGSLDTFSLFIEYGFNVVKQGGHVNFIVPLSVVSSDSMTALHQLLLNNCEIIKVASFCDRPLQIFKNSHKKTAIISFHKTNTTCRKLLTTQMYRWHSGITRKQLLEKMRFVESLKFRLVGRFPKISYSIEKRILKKLFAYKTNIDSLQKTAGKPIYYRTSGGMYYNVITNYSTNSTKEKPLYFDKKIADVIGAILSSNLFWWYQQVYSNNLDLKSYEIESFPIPVEKLNPTIIEQIENLYAKYLRGIQKNIIEHKTAEYVKVELYQEYKIRYSKPLIDLIDDTICPLYGLTDEELDFIKNYELTFRTDE
ncbi:MAG: N-6 DNA methylase [Planctomycetaceae bacterium]|jgi:predicted RNA methylase|nr:N-6 DNA methylase [Planctomycetaceae bacterium]